jgi:DtxR family Mn-dependent transcriptional regulator
MTAAIVLLLAALGAAAWLLLGRSGTSSADRERIQVEDALKHFYTSQTEGRRPTLASTAGRLQISENDAAAVIQRMQSLGLATVEGETLRLTDDGREYALHIVRAHRLWERHLAEETGISESRWHAEAERAEHALTPEEARTLAGRLGNPLTDPHGDPIPTADGINVEKRGVALTTLAPGASGRIVHLEDEPDSVYTDLVEKGFWPGMVVTFLSSSGGEVAVRLDGREVTLSPLGAAAIAVDPVKTPAPSPASERTLADLVVPQTGRIVALSPRCRGAERRRFLDLGIVPGTVVAAELHSPSGDPTAYRIRDTLIALRREQASLIQIEPAAATAPHAAQETHHE